MIPHDIFLGLVFFYHQNQAKVLLRHLVDQENLLEVLFLKVELRGFELLELGLKFENSLLQVRFLGLVF
jgi:hypothetical protein